MRSEEVAGGQIIGDVYDGEPGIDRAVRVLAPGGHVFKLFCGMETVAAPQPGDRPEKFEHASVKVLKMWPLERFLQQGLGFRFSDRMGTTASWWHCDEDHHGMAIVRAPRSELSHYAVTVEDLNAMGRVADRLKLHRDARLIWGPSRHGPGQQPIHVLPRPRRRDDRALLRHRPDGRLPAPQVARRSEADQPVGRAAAACGSSSPASRWCSRPPAARRTR